MIPPLGVNRTMIPAVLTAPVAAAIMADLDVRLAGMDGDGYRLLARTLIARVGDLDRECQNLARDNTVLRERLAIQAPGAASTAPPRVCPVCHHRMPFGIAHYCRPQSTYVPEGEVA